MYDPDMSWGGGNNTPALKLEKLKKLEDILKACGDFYVGASNVINQTYIVKSSMEMNAAEGVNSQYDRRLKVTPFVNMFGPIIDGVSSMVTKKPPVLQEKKTSKAVEMDIQFLDLENVDKEGSDLHTFAKKVCTNSILYGLCFVSVENYLGKGPMHLKMYEYKDLVSYLYSDGILKRIVFKERFEVEDGRFGVKIEERFIVYYPGGGEVWYKDKNAQDIAAQQKWTTNMSVIPMVSIKTGKQVSRLEVIPRFYDIVCINRAILNLESILNKTLIINSEPIPTFWGDKSLELEGKKVGSGLGISLGPRNVCDFKYIEPMGNGIEKISSQIKKLIEDIDRLSFSVLQRTSNRTIIDAEQNESKNTGFLSNTSAELEDKFTKLLYFAAELGGKPLTDDITVNFEKDFDDVAFSKENIEMLYKMVSSGMLSRETLWARLKEKGLLGEDFDVELEITRIGKDEGNEDLNADFVKKGKEAEKPSLGFVKEE